MFMATNAPTQLLQMANIPSSCGLGCILTWHTRGTPHGPVATCGPSPGPGCLVLRASLSPSRHVTIVRQPLDRLRSEATAIPEWPESPPGVLMEFSRVPAYTAKKMRADEFAQASWKPRASRRASSRVAAPLEGRRLYEGFAGVTFPSASRGCVQGRDPSGDTEGARGGIAPNISPLAGEGPPSV
jgi:hypothetical protein